MGKTADLTSVQMMISDTLPKEVSYRRLLLKMLAVYRVLYRCKHMESWLKGRGVVGRGTGLSAASRRQSRKVYSRAWERFTGNGAGVKALTLTNIWNVPQWFNILFSDESKILILIWEIKVWKKSGEAQILSWLWWFGVWTVGVGGRGFIKSTVNTAAYKVFRF